MARVSVAWSNLMHERTRLIVAIAGVSFAVVLIFMNLGFMGALISTATNFYEQFNAELFLISPETLEISTSTAFPRERIYQVAGVDGVERIMPLYSEYLLWRNPETGVSRGIFVYGINPNDPVFLMPELQGTEARRILSRPDTAFIDRLSRPEFGPQEIGTTTEADRRRITIGGTYFLGGGFAADGTLIMSDQNFIRYLEPRPLSLINVGLVKLKLGVSPEKVAATMRALLPADVNVYTKAGIIEHDSAYWLESTSIGFIFSMGVVVSFIVGAVIVYQILFTDIRDHLPEYATMKAMGYRSQYLFKIVLQEAIFLAVLGYIPGLAAALGLYHLTATATAGTLPVAMNGGRVIFVLGLTLLMCSLSGLISVRKAVTADPAEIF
ncbi:ABC transporter permease DevC [Leptothoe spongobia]|uniref:FtsX-like permease family protein n=1 Tax=Leptothoe spongobia TAU-MAC 1115 TaxID=1967444 RepID=A0A947DGM8_9CYAN|nr:ABC transporter permease DevC [Leptothoe spongobia]MBT9315576.1 FtsX-like permease family protein [Leptothoe spongobia TAU-MAC 1115]